MTSWQLEKYARFLGNSERDVYESEPEVDWDYFELGFPSDTIYIAVEQPANLTIKRGIDVLESFTLLQSTDTFKVVARDDCMLFYCKNEQNVRRFRVKFATTEDSDGVKSCNAFIQQIIRYVHVESVSSNGDLNSLNMSQMEKPGPERIDDQNSMSPISIATVAETICSGDSTSLPEYYGAGNLHVEDSTAPSLIKTCLLDPNFPAFVEEVEKQVLSLIDP